MAVFTQVNPGDLSSVLQDFQLGELVSLEGISAGIENTTYFLDTQRQGEPVQHWVLTLFENLPEDDLPFFNRFTQHLAEAGLSVPAPLKNSADASLFTLNGKQAVIVPRLSGKDRKQVSVEDCSKVGAWLARLHMAQSGFDMHRPLVRDLDWMESHFQSLKERDIGEDLALLRAYIDRYAAYRALIAECPHGTVHGDLFRDNVLFQGAEISGVIDFYHACDASLLFDLAVCANDWCVQQAGVYDQACLDALLRAYQGIRPWTEQEVKAWPYSLEVAALRFWISRLVSKFVDSYQQGSLAGNVIKNPDEKRAILLALADPAQPLAI